MRQRASLGSIAAPLSAGGQITRSGDELRNEFWTLTGRLPVDHQSWSRTELFQRVEGCKLLMEEEKLREEEEKSREALLWEVFEVLGGRFPYGIEEYSLKDLNQRIQAAVEFENGWGWPAVEEAKPAGVVGLPGDRIVWTEEDRAELLRGQALYGSSFRDMSRDSSLLFQPALSNLSDKDRAKKLKSYASSPLYIKYKEAHRETDL